MRSLSKSDVVPRGKCRFVDAASVREKLDQLLIFGIITIKGRNSLKEQQSYMTAVIIKEDAAACGDTLETLNIRLKWFLLLHSSGKLKKVCPCNRPRQIYNGHF